MKWYKTLTLQQRINLKGDACEMICGMPFSFMTFMFGFRESIELIYNKLKQEGFDIA